MSVMYTNTVVYYLILAYYCLILLYNFMLLQPRNFNYNSNQNNSTVYNWTPTSLTYGDCGLSTLQPLRMSSRQIARLKIFLNNAVRNSDLTNRQIWFNTFPHMPLTNNPNGVRMGNGTGILNAWQIQIRGGVFVFEFNNLRPGRAIHFFNTIATNIPTNTIPHFNYNSVIQLRGSSSCSPLISAFY